MNDLVEIFGPTMSAEQVCKVCGITRDTLRHWNSQRRISFIKLGHRTVIYRSVDIDALLHEHYRPAIADRSHPNVKSAGGNTTKRKDKSKYRYQAARRMLEEAKRELGL